MIDYLDGSGFAENVPGSSADVDVVGEGGLPHNLLLPAHRVRVVQLKQTRVVKLKQTRVVQLKQTRVVLLKQTRVVQLKQTRVVQL